MKSLVSLFTRHPASVGETYFQHLAHATGFALQMIAAGVCCLVHALLPFLFETTGSATIAALHERMVVNRDRRKRAGKGPGENKATAPATAISAN